MGNKGSFLGLICMGMCVSAAALTGSGDSAVGALETVVPVFSALAAEPPQAGAGQTVTITFSVSESLGANPVVTVNGNAAAFVGEAKAGNYTYDYTVQGSDAIGTAVIEISGWDLLGNPGSLSSAIVLEVQLMPLRGWPVFVGLLLAGLAVLALRRGKGAALVALLLLAAPVALAQAPSVTNVAFVQQPDGAGGTEVVITYDLDAPNGPCDITVSLSKDGGLDGFSFSVTSVTGDLSGVTTGTDHSITWDIAADYPDEDIPQAQIRVTADDALDIDVPEMIPVAGSTFTMGRRDDGDDGPYGFSNEVPRHDVTLSTYEIGKFEITNQQVCDVYNWANGQGYFTTVDATTAQAFGQELLDLDLSYSPIEYGGGVFSPETRTGLPGTTTYSMGDHPAIMISWYGAVAYCNWLSEIMGLTPVYDTGTWTANFANGGYHLPTEAQWERAAAWDGSKHWIYSFTSDTLTGKDRCNYLDFNPDFVNPLGLTSWPYTSPVGWFDGNNTSPNGGIATQDSPAPVGAYDMSGNVWEWCHDWYASDYYTWGGPPWDDPEGPTSGTHRVRRGGSWFNEFYYCRSAYRSGSSPGGSYYHIGFRLAR